MRVLSTATLQVFRGQELYSSSQRAAALKEEAGSGHVLAHGLLCSAVHSYLCLLKQDRHEVKMRKKKKNAMNSSAHARRDHKLDPRF